MPAKKLSDYVAELKAAADKDKGFEPLKQVETLSADLKERSEKRIEALEADRAAYNAEIDKRQLMIIAGKHISWMGIGVENAVDELLL